MHQGTVRVPCVTPTMPLGAPAAPPFPGCTVFSVEVTVLLTKTSVIDGPPAPPPPWPPLAPLPPAPPFPPLPPPPATLPLPPTLPWPPAPPSPPAPPVPPTFVATMFLRSVTLVELPT